MTNENKMPAIEEMKKALSGVFIHQSDDKFTDVKSMTAAPMSFDPYVGKSAPVNSFDRGYHGLVEPELSAYLEYARRDNEDIVSIAWMFQGQEFLGMEAMQMYFILDEDKKIALTDVFVHDIDTNGEGDYTEAAKLSVPVADMIEIATANKIEFSLRCKALTLEEKLTEPQLLAIKGFYNNVFDDEFEVDRLYKYRNSENYQSAKPAESSGGCYIATMAYGDYSHPQVIILRKFRDQVLLKNTIGRSFVSFYYNRSPQLANMLKNQKVMNRIIRKLLDGLICVGNRWYK